MKSFCRQKKSQLSIPIYQWSDFSTHCVSNFQSEFAIETK